MQKIKLIFIVMMLACMLFALFYVIKYRDVLFVQKIKIRYPDGCEELYINGNLNGSVCTEGREMIDEYEDKKRWYLNSSIINLTSQR